MQTFRELTRLSPQFRDHANIINHSISATYLNRSGRQGAQTSFIERQEAKSQLRLDLSQQRFSVAASMGLLFTVSIGSSFLLHTSFPVASCKRALQIWRYCAKSSMWRVLYKNLSLLWLSLFLRLQDTEIFMKTIAVLLSCLA